MPSDKYPLRRRAFLGATGAIAGLGGVGVVAGNTPDGHPIPGRIEAEDFHDYEAVYLERGGETDSDSGSWIWTTGTLAYQVDVTPGLYDITIRAGSWHEEGGVELTLGSTSIGQIEVGGSSEKYDWQEATMESVEITAEGETTLSVGFLGRSTDFGWIEFEKTERPTGYGTGGYGESGFGD
jgi:hypothetical protein